MSTPTQLEAQRRIREAQKILEFRVQHGISDVGEKLSRITHCPEWDEIGKLYDQVRALWHKLNDRALSSKIDLDSEAAAKFLASIEPDGAA